jgi:hypothetical protein
MSAGLSCFECDTLEEPVVAADGRHYRQQSARVSPQHRTAVLDGGVMWSVSLDEDGHDAVDGSNDDDVLLHAAPLSSSAVDDGDDEPWSAGGGGGRRRADATWSSTCHDILAGAEPGNVSAVPAQYKRDCSPLETICGVRSTPLC